MNKIDSDFYGLIDTIKSMEEEELFHIIKFSFSKLPLELQKNLESYFNKFDYWGKLVIAEDNYEEIYLKAKTLYHSLDDYVWLYQKLGDYRSKKILFGILNNWFYYDFRTLSEVGEKCFPHYFDLDLVKSNKETVFVDVGAYTGDTALSFIETYGEENYSKIYCYEITDLSSSLLKNSLSKYRDIVFCKKAVGEENACTSIRIHDDFSANQVGEGGKEVLQVTLDSDITDSISMIKMDIEGSEMAALRGSREHIKNDTPTLLISVYHKNEDLVEIPKLIDSMNPAYDYYLRYYGGDVYPTEIVLVCVKKEA